MIEKTRLGGPSAVAQTKNSYRFSHSGLRVSESFCYQFTAIDEASPGTGPSVRPYRLNAAILIERNVADRSGTCSYVPTEGDVVFWRYPWGTSARY